MAESSDIRLIPATLNPEAKWYMKSKQKYERENKIDPSILIPILADSCYETGNINLALWLDAGDVTSGLAQDVFLNIVYDINHCGISEAATYMHTAATKDIQEFPEGAKAFYVAARFGHYKKDVVAAFDQVKILAEAYGKGTPLIYNPHGYLEKGYSYLIEWAGDPYKRHKASSILGAYPGLKAVTTALLATSPRSQTVNCVELEVNFEEGWCMFHSKPHGSLCNHERKFHLWAEHVEAIRENLKVM